jgi:hypothetical protein
LPIPLAAPVTITTLSLKRFMQILSFAWFQVAR